MSPRDGRRITTRVWVSLDDIIDGDIERFDDLLAEGVGDPLLTDIDYRIVEHRQDAILLEVSGEPCADEQGGDAAA